MVLRLFVESLDLPARTTLGRHWKKLYYVAAIVGGAVFLYGIHLGWGR